MRKERSRLCFQWEMRKCLELLALSWNFANDRAVQGTETMATTFLDGKEMLCSERSMRDVVMISARS